MLTKLENKKLLKWALFSMMGVVAFAPPSEESDSSEQVQNEGDEDRDDQSGVSGYDEDAGSDASTADTESAGSFIVGSVGAVYQPSMEVTNARKEAVKVDSANVAVFAIGGKTGAPSLFKGAEIGGRIGFHYGSRSSLTEKNLVRSPWSMFLGISGGKKINFATDKDFAFGLDLLFLRTGLQTAGSSALTGNSVGFGPFASVAQYFGPLKVGLTARLLGCGGTAYSSPTNNHSPLPTVTGISLFELDQLQDEHCNMMRTYYTQIIRGAGKKGAVNARNKLELILSDLYTRIPPVSSREIANALSKSGSPDKKGVPMAKPRGGRATVTPALARKALLIRIAIRQLHAQAAAIQQAVDKVHEDSQKGTAVTSLNAGLGNAWLHFVEALEDTPFETLASGAGGFKGATERVAYQAARHMRAELTLDLGLNLMHISEA